jgi:NAD(P)-dependent dehydrogenase (short-subunit alcohol dehydrogenase family)
MKKQLEDKLAIVTGGSSGIGKSTAILFAAEGARVAVIDMNAELGMDCVNEIEQQGGEAIFIQADMTSSEDAKRSFDRAIRVHGGLDVVVNCVGGSGRRRGDGPAHECTEEGWDWTLDLNLKSTFLGCKNAIPEFLKHGNGAIVNVSSAIGLVGGDDAFGSHAYATSKGAIISLTRSIAVYYAPEGIRSNAVCPGMIDTPLTARAQNDSRMRQQVQYLQPLTGDFGQPIDVAHGILFLASDSASFLTGVILPIDGGWTAR